MKDDFLRLVPKFVAGQILITPGAQAALEESEQLPITFLKRHLRGDWGEVDKHDQQENELSLQKGFRLLSAYRTSLNVKIWIITEADRSATTILLPEEY